MSRGLHIFIALLLTVSVKTSSESDRCEYGVEETSSCTDSFVSVFHIDSTLYNTDTVSYRNYFDNGVIIPDINFTCDGTVTGCIVGATLGQGELSLNLEIWRAVNGSLHRKVGVSRLQNGTSIGRRVYEYRLMEPLAFRAGDILGISRNDGQGRLYWEESRRLAVYHKNDRYDDEVEFLKSKVLYERNYPLITALTDPMQCGCGFMSLDRVTRLLNGYESTSRGTFTRRRLVLFPEAVFTCNGEVTKWIFGGLWRETDSSYQHFVQLQIWRMAEDGIIQLVNSTTAHLPTSEGDDVYEVIADPPLPFQKGDILGVFHPANSNFYVHYDRYGSSDFYSVTTSELLESFDLQCLDIRTGDSSRDSRAVVQCPDAASTVRGQPLVSVVIVTTTPTCSHCGQYSGSSSVVTTYSVSQTTSLHTQHIIPTTSLGSITPPLQPTLYSMPSSTALAETTTVIRFITPGPPIMDITISSTVTTITASLVMDGTTPVQSVLASETAEFFAVDTRILVGLACGVAFNVLICVTISMILLKCRHRRKQKQEALNSRRINEGEQPCMAYLTASFAHQINEVSSPNDMIHTVTNKAYSGSRELFGSNTADATDQSPDTTSTSTGKYLWYGPGSETSYDYPTSYTVEEPFYDYPSF